jgi:VRR-NUC domain
VLGLNRSAFTATQTRSKKEFGPSEDQIQRAVIAHLQQRAAPGVVWWHTPNGGKRDRIEAARFKGMGVRSGVADLVLVHRGSVYAIELKSATGRPTTSQMEWMSAFNAAGGNGCICYDLDRALQMLERWGILSEPLGRAASRPTPADAASEPARDLPPDTLMRGLANSAMRG